MALQALGNWNQQADLLPFLHSLMMRSSNVQQGSGLDSYAKQWRLFADCFNNVGATANSSLALIMAVLARHCCSDSS